MDQLQIIHVHKDHISSIPEVVETYRLSPDKLSIPAQFLRLETMQKVINDLRRRPTTRALGYTESWSPGKARKDRSGGRGDIFRYSYKVGELTVECLGLRSAFRAENLENNLDLASYLTRVTRPADQASVVVLGDLRGADLEAIRAGMEAQKPGAWAELFKGVTTVSGFAHHLGAIKSKDVPGLMALLEVTLLRTGTLRVVEQTNPNDHTQVRADTIELLSRLGIKLVTAEMPTAGAAASSASASKNEVSSSGPQARTGSTTASPLTEGLARIQRLMLARETFEIWRPVFEQNKSSSKLIKAEILPQIEQSLEQLRAAIREAIEAGLRVRAEGQKVQGGTARDYGTTGGRLGGAYVTALGRIPGMTPAEARLGPEGFEELARYRNMNAKDVPLSVAINAALMRGEYSDKAFAAMLGALHPSIRDDLLSGPRAGRSSKLKAFERVVVQYSFQKAVLETSEEMSIPRHWSPGAQAGARGAVGLLAFLELWESVIRPTIDSIKIQKRLFTDKNLVPFLRRFLFWRQMYILPKLVGVDDGFLSITKEHDPQKVVDGLNAQSWDALYIEEPGISDADVIIFGAWISYFIRNLDEFEVFFMDSFQDAIRWEGDDWKKATWKIKVGRYNESFENHVEEYWYCHDKLTELMRVYTARIIANTEELLAEHGKQGAISKETEARIGTLNHFPVPLVPMYRAHLKSGLTQLPGAPTPVQVFRTGYQAQWEDREVLWYSPPRFYVYRDEGEHLEVGGADFNTYSRLRAIPTEDRTLWMGQNGNFTTKTNTRNVSGVVRIQKSLIEADGNDQK